MHDPIELAFKRGFGRGLMPLNGKVAALDGWRTMPDATEDQVRDWTEQGLNLGLRMGRASGLFVIDDDQSKHDAEGYTPPPTDLVSVSPTGGMHFFYEWVEGLGNSASRLAPYVDTRGEGGYVVYAGSAHPVTRTPYRWLSIGKPGTLPAETLAVLQGTPAARPAPAPAPAPRGTGYADAALHREVHAVRTAGEGGRNSALNRAAFSLGQLVAGGVLERAIVEAALTEAATLSGLAQGEIQATLRSGLNAGAASPRQAPERPQRAHATATAPRAAPAAPPAERPTVLVPGSHNTPPDGAYRKQGTDTFSAAVLAALPVGTLYRRAEQLGTITSEGFRATPADYLRSVVDQHVELVAGKECKEPNADGSPAYALQYRPCTHDNAAVVLAYAATNGQVRNLDFLATHPVLIGRDFTTAQPGWNEPGVFLACDHVPDPLDLPTSRAVLEDLVCDFPFQAPADRANYFGLLLTPILRPALREPVPMHLIGSPIERTGKTKLAETVLGCAILGTPTPALQIGVREEEREKRITSLLLAGHSIAHLDNLREFVDSPALASLLTSNTFQGRELGQSRIVTIPNGLTLVASGNNIHATGEIAKRIVPIRLLPPTESPETRQDYKHPDLRGYVEAERYRVLGALLGLVEAWRTAGRPLAGVGFGGFERWHAVLGGILHTAGYDEWLTNLAEWRGDAADFSTELVELVKAWRERNGGGQMECAALFDLAVTELGLFERQTSGSTERGQRTSFGMRVLNHIQGRVVLGYRIQIDGQGKRRRAWLDQV